jgi:hypothetical protein
MPRPCCGSNGTQQQQQQRMESFQQNLNRQLGSQAPALVAVRHACAVAAAACMPATKQHAPYLHTSPHRVPCLPFFSACRIHKRLIDLHSPADVVKQITSIR